MKRLRLLGGTVLVISMFWILGVIFSTSSVNAATINVEAGLGDSETNSHCSIAEAIANINDQGTVFVDCSPVGIYGEDDTLNLPVGTIALNGNLPEIQRSVVIQGQGMGQTIIDGDGEYTVFRNLTSDPNILTYVSGMTFTSISGAAVYTQGSSDVIIDNLEVDGYGSVPASGNMYGLYFMNDTALENTVTASNIYIHNYHSDYGSLHTFVVGGNGSGITNVDFQNITIDDISNSGIINVLMVGNGVYGGGFSPHTSNGSISNVTISNIESDSAIGTLFADTMTATGESTINLDVSNVTIKNVHGSVSPYSGTAGLGAATLAIDSSAVASAHVVARNVLLSDISTDGTSSACIELDLTPSFGGSGTANVSISSSGGNISDDDSCTSSFTDPTDQNNVDPADLMLGTLGDYGGSIPTIPLLPGSIAIDSGTTVAGLTTDARGITRPQCAAYDSGAYEYNGTCPTTTTGEGNVLTYPDPITSSTVTLELPSDVTNGTVSAISPTTIPKDTFFSYPLGLTSFQFDTTIGATKTITLYYDLPGDPSSYTARKYNTNTKTFATITNATITRVTYNNKSMLKLTYDITDGGTLDQDNVANGTIVDPVGLATVSVGVPETGL